MHRQSSSIGDAGPLAAITEVLARYWWATAMRGVVAIIFGILAWVMSVTTLAALVLLYGSYALVDGWLGLSGPVSIISGAFVMVAPPEARRPSVGQRMYEREPSPRGEVPWSH
jgi:hypothetical protein